MSKVYKEHFVACLDLLGFRDALESNLHDIKIEKMLEHFETLVREEQITTNSYNGNHSIEINPSITAQSDQIKITCPIKDIKFPFDISSALNAIIPIASQIIINALMRGFLIRGAIMYGKSYSFINSNGEFGPFDLAYADALKLESIAKLPIVIVPIELGKLIPDINYESFQLLKKIEIANKHYFFIDFLQFAFRKNSKAIKELFCHVKPMIEKNLQETKYIESAHSKWLWFKDYFDTSFREYEK